MQDLSTDESPSFVNGVLGAVLRSRVQHPLARRTVGRVHLLEDLDLVADPDGHPGVSQTRLVPNHTAPSQRRNRAIVAVGSLNRSAVSSSVVGMVQRAQPLTER